MKYPLNLLILNQNQTHYMIPCFEELRQAIGKRCQAKFYGPGHPGYDPNLKDIRAIVRKLYPGSSKPDALLTGEPNLWGMGNLSVRDFPGLKATFLEDMQEVHYPTYLDFMRSNRFDLVFYRYNSFGLAERKEIAPWANFIWSPHFASDLFLNQPALPKKFDVFLSGNTFGPYYPLRKRISKILGHQRWRIPFKCMVLKHPGYFYGRKCRAVYGPNYARLLASSRCSIVTGSLYEYAVLKYFESAACGAVILTPKFQYSKDLERLGFIHDETMIEFDFKPDSSLRGNLVQFVSHILADEKRLDRIRTNARRLVQKNHRIDQRAEQIVRTIAERCRNHYREMVL